MEELSGSQKLALNSADAGYIAFGTIPLALLAAYFAGDSALVRAAAITLVSLPILGVVATLITCSFGNRDGLLLALSIGTLLLAPVLLLMSIPTVSHHIMDVWYIKYGAWIYMIGCAGSVIAWFAWRRRLAKHRLCAPPEHLPWK